MAKLKIDSVDVMTELEKIGWKHEALNESEIRCLCPSHEDTVPSVSFNVVKKLWACHACHAKGDVITFIAYATKRSRAEVIKDLGRRYDLKEVKEVNPQLVETWHADIDDAGPLLKALRDRGVTDECIRKGRIGFHQNRITIPVYDIQGRIINVRRYLPGAQQMKVVNLTGFGAPALYQVEQVVNHEVVWVCGGELKALVVGVMLAKSKIGACSAASGEKQWESEWSVLFKGKRVYVCMDVDKTGRQAARAVAKELFPYALSVHIVDLPLDKEKYPKGDVSDYIGQEGATADDLIRLMSLAPVFLPPARKESAPTEVKQVKLSSVAEPSNVGYRLQFDAIISAMDPTPYLVPKTIDVGCSRDQELCPQCPILTMDMDEHTGFTRAIVKSSSAAIIDMVGTHKSTQRESIKDGLGIPACKVVEFVVVDHHVVVDARLAPKLEIGGEGENNISQPAYCVGRKVDLNTPYCFAGAVYPHPRSQQATVVLDDSTEAADSLSSFAPSDEDFESLKIFQPREWTPEGIDGKLHELYADLEANVTRIFGRRDLHLIFDLTYHSPLYIPFDGRTVNGWLNSIVVGDSSQGKSETSSSMMKHYGLGERMDCKNATVAGLLGGVMQMGSSKWFVSWGIIPTHDRRLVFLEEVKGTSTDVLGRLTDMRSSGIAEITKIEKRRAYARTRLGFITNPRSQRSISSYGFGCETLQEVIGNLEDIRRFDIALIVSSAQIDPALINRYSAQRPKVEHRFTNELCRRLILWSWTRRYDQVAFEPEAERMIFDSANELCIKFSEALPLIDRGTARHKLARLAASLAARTFSHDEDRNVILVRACHAKKIAMFIDRIYSDPTFGYADFSAAQEKTGRMSDRAEVRRRIIDTRYPLDIVRQMLYRDEITPQDAQDWYEMDRDQARGEISFLVRKHALRRKDRDGYVKSADFIALLREMEKEGDQLKKQQTKGEY